MRIKSPFRDYYDGVAFSEEPLYVRRTVQYGEEKIFSLIDGISSLYYQKGVIFFCGEPTRFVQVTDKGVTDNGESYTFYRASAMENYLANTPYYKLWKKESDGKYNPKMARWREKEAKGFQPIDGVEITGYLQREIYSWLHRIEINRWANNTGMENVASYIRDFADKGVNSDCINIPIIIWKPHVLIVNPQLSPYSFGKIKDAQTAYQSIEMFLSNIAHPNKPILPISDRDMRDAKGFDKWSFRKEKTK